jgi:hypothetical protein
VAEFQIVDVANAEDAEVYRMALGHAWKWFVHHSTQRLLLVNFWIVSTAFLTTALVTALTRSAWGVGALVSGAGALVAVCFQLLDRRCRQLVKGGEAALLHFQRDLAVGSGVPELQILAGVHGDAQRGSYRVVIGVLHGSAAGLFVAAAGFSAVQWIRALG